MIFRGFPNQNKIANMPKNVPAILDVTGCPSRNSNKAAYHMFSSGKDGCFQ